MHCQPLIMEMLKHYQIEQALLDDSVRKNELQNICEFFDEVIEFPHITMTMLVELKKILDTGKSPASVTTAVFESMLIALAPLQYLTETPYFYSLYTAKLGPAYLAMLRIAREKEMNNNDIKSSLGVRRVREQIKLFEEQLKILEGFINPETKLEIINQMNDLKKRMAEYNKGAFEAVQHKPSAQTSAATTPTTTNSNQSTWYESALINIILAYNKNHSADQQIKLTTDEKLMRVIFSNLRNIKPTVSAMIRMLDQFQRRLEHLEAEKVKYKETNPNPDEIAASSITAIFYASAIAGMKIDQDPAFWNSDLIDTKNNAMNQLGFTKKSLAAFERRHLAQLDYRVDLPLSIIHDTAKSYVSMHIPIDITMTDEVLMRLNAVIDVESKKIQTLLMNGVSIQHHSEFSAITDADINTINANREKHKVEIDAAQNRINEATQEIDKRVKMLSTKLHEPVAQDLLKRLNQKKSALEQAETDLQIIKTTEKQLIDAIRKKYLPKTGLPVRGSYLKQTKEENDLKEESKSHIIELEYSIKNISTEITTLLNEIKKYAASTNQTATTTTEQTNSAESHETTKHKQKNPLQERLVTIFKFIEPEDLIPVEKELHQASMSTSLTIEALSSILLVRGNVAGDNANARFPSTVQPSTTAPDDDIAQKKSRTRKRSNSISFPDTLFHGKNVGMERVDKSPLVDSSRVRTNPNTPKKK